MELFKGKLYRGYVGDIAENFDQFMHKATNTQKYCHRFDIEVEHEIFNCQLCIDTPTQHFCGIFEEVEFKISSFQAGKNQYTLESINRVSATAVPKIPVSTGSMQPKEKSPEDFIQEIRNSPLQIVDNSNIAIAALQAASEFWTKKNDIPFSPGADQTANDVIVTAEFYYNWLKSKNL